jgi:hypothetical protein
VPGAETELAPAPYPPALWSNSGMARWMLGVVSVVLGPVALAVSACRSQAAAVGPSVELTRVPEAAEGGPDRMAPIAGRARGVRPGQRVVLYARSGPWWVQPLAAQPFTALDADSNFDNTTHLGTEYAALLVEPGYKPPSRTDELPALGGGVVALARVKGVAPAEARAPRTLQFAGYEWKVRDTPSERGGWTNRYDPANAWTDEAGALHLRIAPTDEGWTSAEVILTRSLGYGTYSFVVRDVSHLAPAVVMGLFTWDDMAGDQRFREMDVEISRWGDPSNVNAQYVVQPYYVPANVSRFQAPAGRLTHSLRWEVGRASLRTVRGAAVPGSQRRVAEHVFTSGVPLPGSETVRINLYVFGNAPLTLPLPTEVVVESFEYLP